MATPNSAPNQQLEEPGFFRGLPAQPAAAPAPTTPRARRPASPPPTPARVALAAPWADPTKWDEITIAACAFTGKVTVSGDALKPKSDHRSSRGRNGARHVAAGHDTVDFTVTLGAFPEDDEAREDLHVQEMDAIYARLSDEAPTRQGSSAFPVSYPSLAFARIYQATVESVSLPEYDASTGMVVMTIKFKSFKEPVPRTVRATATPAETPAALGNGRNGDLAAGRANGTISMTPTTRGRAIPRPSASGAAAPRT